jgi:TonB family protein
VHFLLFALFQTIAADGVRVYVAPALDDSTSYLSGKVGIEVLVGEDGSVEEVRSNACAGDARLLSLAETAARQWKFAPSRPGWRTITFDVAPEAETMDETRVDTRYETPLTLHTMRTVSLVLRWPRVNGKPPEKSCAVHHEPMRLVTLNMGGTGPPGYDHSALLEEWLRAFVNKFPNSGESISLGCEGRREKFGEAFLCDSCQKARKAWLAAHHLERPPQ